MKVYKVISVGHDKNTAEVVLRDRFGNLETKHVRRMGRSDRFTYGFRTRNGRGPFIQEGTIQLDI